jgi:hypothetical protein
MAAGLAGADELRRLPGIGPRFQAILSAGEELLSASFLACATAEEFERALSRFYVACVQPPLHNATLCRRASVVRHALNHLLHCPDSLPVKLERCLATDGPYHVGGLGPAFWSALAQGFDPQRHPSWMPAVVEGLRRLGLGGWGSDAGAGEVYAAITQAYARIQAHQPGMSALHIDHFLGLVASMHNRQLWSGASRLETSAVVHDLFALLQTERGRVASGQRLKERGPALEAARDQLEAAIASGDAGQLGAALAVADPLGARRARIRWRMHAAALLDWVSRLWQAEEPLEIAEEFWRVDAVPGGGLWLAAAVLHLREPRHFQPWNEATRRGYALVDESAESSESLRERYQLYNEGVERLCELYRLHLLEAPAVLAALDSTEGEAMGSAAPELTRFGGFCADTFRFLTELADNNNRAWMDQQRERYAYAVRGPMLELCRALAERYVKPVLNGKLGWNVECTPRSGRALTSICKNDYGRSTPYYTTLWITFYRRGPDRHAAAQLFVQLDATGVRYGMRLGQLTGEVGERFRHALSEYGATLYRALERNGVVDECTFNGQRLAGPTGLQEWADGRELVIAKWLPADAALLEADDLVGEILLTLDRLLPAYACAVEVVPLPFLRRHAGVPGAEGEFTERDFEAATFLGADWLRRARGLLDLKRQLILQGVPGTGKTHVARCLAQLLTHGQDTAIRLVQFHPAYSYEEFVEGIKVRSVEIEGRHDVTYPVEDGLLCTFAAEAAGKPEQPHVLLIDELNRGNLPRIFGELLYLLEYREHSVALPYSRRAFRLPANLYLIGTMNGADRSVALVDQALRRRFSFLDMPPDAGVLASWLRRHPPAVGPEFAEHIVALFERLNTRLDADLGTQYRVGHSYFMVPDLDEARLQVVWDHHVRPALDEYFTGQPGRAAAYDFDKLFRGERPREGRRRRAGRAEVS